MNRPKTPGSARSQQGIALVVVLILLLIMTLLGLASMRGALMEERMSANMYDRSLGFQAAEAALREAETRLVLPGTRAAVPIAANSCNNGLCSAPVPAQGTPDRALDATFNGWLPASKVSDLGGTPQYFVEYMGDAPGWPLCDRQVPMHASCMRPRYRITSRSNETDRAEVILQSSFAGS